MNGNGTQCRLLDKDSIKNQLREIWGQVLEEDPRSFSDEDVFFEVGGDSLLAHEVAVVAERHGILLDLPEIFMSTSLKDMAQTARPAGIDEDEQNGLNHTSNSNAKISRVVEREAALRSRMDDIATACNVTVETVESAYPCSPMQESLVAEFDGGKNLYVMQYVFKLAGNIPFNRFRHVWEDTIYTNPILRTRICQLEGTNGYTQAVMKEGVQWNTVRVDLARFLECDANVPMELGHPFFRYTIVIDEDENHITTRYFIWTVHHALCDAVSLEEVLWDVSNRWLDQTPLPRQSFESFIESHFTMPGSMQAQEQEFWRKNLSGTNPTPYPSPPQISKCQPNPTCTLERPLTLERLPHFGITKALLLRAAWAILVSHYTGTEDVGFGTISNGRGPIMHGVSQTTGPTINLVPTALRVDPEQSVASFLTQVRTQAAEVMSFEHSGISKIRKFMADRNTTAVDFQTLFVVQPAALFKAAAPALRTLGLDFVESMGKRERHPYPLILTLTPSDDTVIRLNIQHDGRVVSSQDAHNLVHHFQAVLTQLSHATTHTLLGSISPFSDHDMHQLRQWNSFTAPAENTCIHYLFQEQVSRNPSAVAVCSLEESLTYHDVDKYSTSFALHLINFGVRPGNLLGVCLEKSIWTVVAALAVFKAGGIYVPIDPSHPQGRIQEVLEMAQIDVVMTSKLNLKILDGLSVQAFTIQGPPPPPPLAAELLPKSLPSSTAYILFTSGTTGKPKGILMSHSAICTSIIHHGPAFGAGPHWRTLQFAAHMFDLSIGEFFTTLTFGGCICVPSEHDRHNNLAGVIKALQANTLLVVPTVVNLLSPADVPTLSTIVLAGEPITKGTIVKWADHVDLTAAYGPTETAVWCSGNLRVTPDAHPANIGRSLGASMWIVDPDNYRQLSAIGCVGEIVISGGLLGEGYLRDEIATDAAFVPAPDWLRKIDPKAKMLYRSGDLARYNSDGTFHIVGRSDTQVKLRGFRIELGEVENQIMTQGTVMAAIAALPKTGPCAGQIVAVLSSGKSALGNVGGIVIRIAADGRFLMDRVKRHLSLTLPDYMIPSVWVTVDKMPLLTSGKIDRKAIKLWIETMSYDRYVELVDGTDTKGATEIRPGTLADTLRQLWSQVLNAPEEVIGMDTSFLALGGDSIAAIQVVSRGKGIGLHLTVREILSTKTIGNLLTLVEPNQNIVTAAPEPVESPRRTSDILKPFEQALQPHLSDKPFVEVHDAYHLSPIQREIIKARASNPAVFLLLLHMEFTSINSQPVSLSRLVRSWQRVVQKYPILRTIFIQDPAGKLPPLQVVLKNVAPEVRTSSAPASSIEPNFDTVGAPPVDDCFLPHRAHISQCGDRFFIHLECDHLVIDGWSLKLIKTAFLEAYEENEAYVPEETASYKDFVTAHRPDRVQEDNKYWASALREQRPSLLSLPIRSKESSHQPSQSRTKSIIYLPILKVESMAEFSIKHGVTPASIFDSAWAQTLSLYTGSSEVTFEYVVSGRDEDVDYVFDIVGPLINVVPYYLQGVPTEGSSLQLAQLAQRVQEQRMKDSLHNSSNVREVIANELPQGKLFNTAVNFQRRPTAVETDRWRIDEDLTKTRDPWHVSYRTRFP